MNEKIIFSQNRFEYDGTHLYYLPKNIFEKLEQPKPIYLIGTRGTGKTTFLKALSAQERLENKSLQRALNDDLFGQCYIGIYIKLPRHLPNHFQNWLSEPKNKSYAGEIFSFSIDLLWLELLTKRISKFLSIEGGPYKIFDASIEEESNLVKNILESYPMLAWDKIEKKDCTLQRLSDLLRQKKYVLENYAKSKEDTSELYREFPLEQIGEFGRRVGSILGNFCNTHSVKPFSDWHFKICIDEAEWFSGYQETIINTMVRLSERPVFFIVSYVRDREKKGEGDIFSTVSKDVTVGQPDREIINLDNDIENSQEFFEGVATIRIQEALENRNIIFSLTHILGSLDINNLLLDIIKQSKNPEAKIWTKKAKELSRTGFWSYSDSDKNIQKSEEELSDDSSVLPIYQAYQINKLGLKILMPGTDSWKERGQKKAEIRKRMVASYLCLCKELKKRDIPFAYSRMVIQMSDNCIRDFLNQINELFISSRRTLKDFTEKALPVKIQQEALFNASEKKKSNIPRSRASYPVEIGKIIEGLGHITRFIQCEGPNNNALLSPERGRFVVDFGNKKSDSVLWEYINDAVEAGYVKIIKKEGPLLTFRLHASLAAYYCFSYRGAHTETRGLTTSDLNIFLETDGDNNIRSVAELIGKRLVGYENPNQLPLFKGKLS